MCIKGRKVAKPCSHFHILSGVRVCGTHKHWTTALGLGGTL